MARTMIKPALDLTDMADIDFENDAEIFYEYDTLTREGTQPERALFQNYVVIFLHNNCHIFFMFDPYILFSFCITGAIFGEDG